ncbi:MAG: flagellar basal-body MS-ring/collar protein FliF [Burkholderiales bacterium]
MATSSENALGRKLPAWTRIPPQQLLSLMLVVAAGLALVVGGWMWSTTPDYRVLYSNLSDRDGGAVIAALQQMNVPYKFADGGGALLVPADAVHDARLRLASQGLPKGGLNGFELMEGQRFGASQFLEQVNYQRGLEGELARSIQTLQSVQSARVHLALSKTSAFLREQPAASASVLVHLYPGRTLDAMQVAAIVHLVTNSVAGLSTKNVSVVDQNGTLLSGDASGTGAIDKTQLKYRQDLEQTFVQRIEAILVPVVGAGNVKAQVSADMDFSEIEQAEEVYKPNQKPDAASVRAQQTSETSGSSGQGSAAGVPGALSNQPPGPASAPISGGQGATAAPTQTAPGATTTQRRDSSVSYEVDKSIRHTKMAHGRLKRLSVAVVLNDRVTTDAAGKSTGKPLTDAEKEQITDLVKGVVGYDKERGDVLSVINSTFKMRDVEKVVEVPLWKQPSTIALAKDSGKYLLIGAVLLFLLLRVFKPMIANLSRVPPAPQLEVIPGAPLAHGLPHPHPYENSLQTARQIAKQDPKIVANVVKDWVAGNEQ